MRSNPGARRAEPFQYTNLAGGGRPIAGKILPFAQRYPQRDHRSDSLEPVGHRALSSPITMRYHIRGHARSTDACRRTDWYSEERATTVGPFTSAKGSVLILPGRSARQ
ncbi:MAG: hypothetical protein D6753_05490 [Planctomycetota bacterium]|nr:MAG: hypothetical protein D6753_05490 [Planctomycetota bacterium]